MNIFISFFFTIIYKFDEYKCTNGVTGEFDNDEWKFLPSDDIDSECSLYFNKSKYEVKLTVIKGTPDENLSITRLKDKYLSIFIKISCWNMKRYKLTIPTCYTYSLKNLNCSSCKKNNYEE